MPVVWHPLISGLWEFNPFRVFFVTMKARKVSRQGKLRFLTACACISKKDTTRCKAGD